MTRRFPACRFPLERDDKLLDSLASASGISRGYRGILVRTPTANVADLRRGHCASGIASARLRRWTSSQAPGTRDIRALRVHSESTLFGKHAPRRWFFGGQPFVDFHGSAGGIPGCVLSGGDSPRADGTRNALRRLAFVEYASRVPAFWPRFSPAMPSTEQFSWALYRKNREYEAAIGLAVAMAILVDSHAVAAMKVGRGYGFGWRNVLTLMFVPLVFAVMAPSRSVR